MKYRTRKDFTAVELEEIKTVVLTTGLDNGGRLRSKIIVELATKHKTRIGTMDNIIRKTFCLGERNVSLNFEQCDQIRTIYEQNPERKRLKHEIIDDLAQRFGVKPSQIRTAIETSRRFW